MHTEYKSHHVRGAGLCCDYSARLSDLMHYHCTHNHGRKFPLSYYGHKTLYHFWACWYTDVQEAFVGLIQSAVGERKAKTGWLAYVGMLLCYSALISYLEKKNKHVVKHAWNMTIKTISKTITMLRNHSAFNSIIVFHESRSWWYCVIESIPATHLSLLHHLQEEWFHFPANQISVSFETISFPPTRNKT